MQNYKEIDFGDDYLDDIEPVAQVIKSKKKFKLNKKYIALIIITIAVLAILVKSFSDYRLSGLAQNKIDSDKDIGLLLAKVGRHMLLPESTPNVFVIQDPELLLKDQSFFIGAEKGDRLIVYPESGKAIVYSVSKDLIINSGPVNFNGAAGATSSPQNLVDVKVEGAKTVSKVKTR